MQKCRGCLRRVAGLLAVIFPLEAHGSPDRGIVLRAAFAKVRGEPAKSVRKPPGSTIVTFIPRGHTSLFSDSEKPSTPNLAAAYGARPMGPTRPAIDVIWTMCPVRRSR